MNKKTEAQTPAEEIGKEKKDMYDTYRDYVGAATSDEDRQKRINRFRAGMGRYDTPDQASGEHKENSKF